MEYYRYAFDGAKAINNTYFLAALAGNMGVIFMNQDSLDRAEELFLESIRAAESINNQNLYIDETSNISQVYLRKGDFENSKKYIASLAPLPKKWMTKMAY